MNNLFRSPAWHLACFGALIAAGCGKKLPELPKTYPVTGKVTVGGGKSCAGLVINFKCVESLSYNGTALVTPDGTYKASALPRVAGLVAGDYEVWLEEGTAAKGVLADKYKKTETSGLKLNVKEGDNPPFDISLE
jgi:hypothetical protein